MANTYTQIHIQTIFTVQNRNSLIDQEWKNELYQYISGIVQNQGHKMLQINGMPDHVHVLFGMRPNQALSDLMKKIKGDSTRWINEKRFIHTRFSWQEGFGAFSYSKSQVPRVIKYIKNQEKHHKKRTFRDEYVALLQAAHIDYDKRYIFKPVV